MLIKQQASIRLLLWKQRAAQSRWKPKYVEINSPLLLMRASPGQSSGWRARQGFLEKTGRTLIRVNARRQKSALKNDFRKGMKARRVRRFSTPLY